MAVRDWHAHPAGRGWQDMSGPDRRAEARIANLAREITGLPLVSLTTRGGAGGSWSARVWDAGLGRDIDCRATESVRVIADRLRVAFARPVPADPVGPIQTKLARAGGPYALMRCAKFGDKRIEVRPCEVEQELIFCANRGLYDPVPVAQ